MRVVHESADGRRSVLATDVERADSGLAQMLGLRFRDEPDEGFALVFEFDRPRRGLTDMLFVPFPIDVVWLRDDEVVRVETLPAWRGMAFVKSDGFVEFPAGTAADVEPGDHLYVLGGSTESAVTLGGGDTTTHPSPATTGLRGRYRGRTRHQGRGRRRGRGRRQGRDPKQNRGRYRGRGRHRSRDRNRGQDRSGGRSGSTGRRP